MSNYFQTDFYVLFFLQVTVAHTRHSQNTGSKLINHERTVEVSFGRIRKISMEKVHYKTCIIVNHDER